MSIETAQFLLTMLNNVQIRVGGDDFDIVVPQVTAARDALRGIVDGSLVVIPAPLTVSDGAAASSADA